MATWQNLPDVVQVVKNKPLRYERLFNVLLGLRRFAPFSLPPRAIIDQAKARPARAGLLFLHRTATYESELSTCRYGTKKAFNKG